MRRTLELGTRDRGLQLRPPLHKPRKITLHQQMLSALKGEAWPFVLFFAAFPLWWLLGLGVLGNLLMALPLGYYLLRRRRITVPAGFGFWLLFLAVAFTGVVVLWVPVPGLAPETGIAGLLPWGYRMPWFLAVTIVLLYIGNSSEKELPSKRVIQLMAWMFIITLAGGYAGHYFSAVDFPSLLEIALPNWVANNTFAHNLIHPGLAQVQDILGYPAPRPKAPFEYANSWGANFGMFLPFFLLNFRYARTRSHRVVIAMLLILAVPPVIFSLNRGLWLGLAVLASVAGIRWALKARWLAVASLTVVGFVGYVVMLMSPLGELIQARLDNPHSNEARGNLAGITLRTVLQNSPIIGFGSPRERENNFFSIAAGATPSCSQCSPPQLGTQGTLWYLIFATGFLGAALFILFIARRIVPAITDPHPMAWSLIYPILFFICVLPFYDIVAAPLMTLMISIGLLWRLERDRLPRQEFDGRTLNGDIA